MPAHSAPSQSHFSTSHASSGKLAGGVPKPLIIAGAVVAGLLVVYVAGCIFFNHRFWPNTVMGKSDISLATPASAATIVDQASQIRTVEVSGQGLTFTIDGVTAGISVNAAGATNAAISDNKCWQWPVQIFLSHSETDALTTSFDTEQLRQQIEAKVALHNSTANPPTDAYLYYDANRGGFEINPGSIGNTIDIDRTMTAVMNALINEVPHAAITSTELVPQQITASDESLIIARDTANSFLGCDFALTVQGNWVASVNSDTVQAVLNIDGTNVSIDYGKISAWVDLVEKQVDTVGIERSYVRADGKYVTVEGGSYGWMSDGIWLEEIVIEAIENQVVGSVEIPMLQTGATFAPGGADWGGKYVDVDLTEQHAYFFGDDGSLVLDTDIISGQIAGEGLEPGETRATPTGAYYVTWMAREQTLKGLPDPKNNGKPLYETLVHFWMPFIENMVGLHDAYWQPYFGGTLNQTPFGSHGCVNLPPAVAEWAYYNYIEVGTPVVTHY